MAYRYKKDLEALLNELEYCKDRKRLSALWQEFYGDKIPSNLSTRILKIAVIYGVQVSLYEGKIGNLVSMCEPVTSDEVTLIKALPKQISLENGVILKKIWKGKEIRVEVNEAKFVFENAQYSSLSEIAREITGTRWSGPRFFGLNE